MLSLRATTKLLHINSSRNVSGLVFNDMCPTLKKWLPNDNNLPGLYDIAKKLMRNLGLKFVKIHACPNDYTLYYTKTKSLTMCISCGLSRYIHDVGGKATKSVVRKFFNITLSFLGYNGYLCYRIH